MIYILFILYAAALFCAIMLSIADFRHRIIPDAFLFPMMLIGLFLVAFRPFGFVGLPWVSGGVMESVLAALIGYAMGVVINAIFKIIKKNKEQGTGNKKLSSSNLKPQTLNLADDYEPIGFGDVKLLATGGIWLGVTGLSVALVSACVFGLIWGMRRKQRFVPFAPFFFMGAVIAIGAWIFGIF